MRLATKLLFALAAVAATPPSANRFAQNPLITQQMSSTLGDNINGPSIVRVPAWVRNPLGRYYLYFANHRGRFIRMAYSNNLAGPWKVYEPGVLDVKDTLFYRPQPDPVGPAHHFYTHVASPEVIVDEVNKRLVMLVHGSVTDGKQWPDDSKEAIRWAQQNGYGQYTQTTDSPDGLRFNPRPEVTVPTPMRACSAGTGPGTAWRGSVYLDDPRT